MFIDESKEEEIFNSMEIDLGCCIRECHAPIVGTQTKTYLTKKGFYTSPFFH